MNNNRRLDVWAIQFCPENLKKALLNLKTDNDIVIFSNILSNLRIGKYVMVPRWFDACLYSAENDLLVMLMNGGQVTVDDIKEYLDTKLLNYNEVIFSLQDIDYINNFSIPDFWFARDNISLEKAFLDSVNKGYKNCFYYPSLDGRLDLGYLTNFEKEKGENLINFDARNIKGLIQFDDKVILLTHRMQKHKQIGATIDDVKELSLKYDIDYQICDNKQFNLKNLNKPKEKKLSLLKKNYRA